MAHQNMNRTALVLVLFTLGGVPSLAQQPEPAQASPTPIEAGPAEPREIPVIITVSGGISLGAHEAGLNWAMLKFIKSHRKPSGILPGVRLLSVTGASAGNINAILAAVELCKKNTPQDSVRNNLFFKTWTEVGWERLFPGDQTCEHYQSYTKTNLHCRATCEKDKAQFGTSASCDGDIPAYRPDDGLFTRRAFVDVEAAVADTIQTGSFEPDCDVAVGVTTTKERPSQLWIATGGSAPSGSPSSRTGHLAIDTQRWVTVLRTKTEGGRLKFLERAFPDDERLGSYLHLPHQGPSREVGVRDILDLTEASSAFPAAFGPKLLRYCAPRSNELESPSSHCEPGEVEKEDYFIDGGLFDNIPLGLGHSLAESMSRIYRDSLAPNPHFFFMDPERLRHSAGQQALAQVSEPVRKSQKSHSGLAHMVQLLSSSVAVARQYELQTVARYVWPQKHHARLHVADRFSPITGHYLAAFAAFLTRSFRDFDYYVGVYDGAYTMAQWACDVAGTPDSASAKCLLEQLQQAYQDLGIHEDPVAATIFHALLVREFETWQRLEPGRSEELSALAEAARAWSRNTPPAQMDPEQVRLTTQNLLSATKTLLEEDLEALDKVAEFERAKAECDELKQRIKQTPPHQRLPLRKQEEQCDKKLTQVRQERDELLARSAQNKDDFGRFLELVQSDELAWSGAVSADHERKFLSDPESFANATLLELIDRQRVIEHGAGNKRLALAAGLAEVTLATQEDRLLVGQSWLSTSIPEGDITVGKVIASALPSRVSTDFNSVLEIGHESVLLGRGRIGLTVPGNLTWYWNEKRMTVSIGPGVAVRTPWKWASTVDAAYRYSMKLDDQSTNQVGLSGAEIGVRTLGGKVRVSLVMDDVTHLSNLSTLSLRFGFVDVNGMIYWVGRTLLSP